MNNIEELRAEVQSIRNELKSIDERLNRIDTGLIRFIEKPFTDLNYENLYRLAEMMPIIKHPFSELTEVEKQFYFHILYMTTQAEGNINSKQMLFLQQIIMTDSINNRLEYYIEKCGELNTEEILIRLPEKMKKELSNTLLLDMIILLNHGNAPSRLGYGWIADVATLMGKGKREIKTVGIFASAILKQSVPDISLSAGETVECNRKYGHYLVFIQGWPQKVEVAQREHNEILKGIRFAEYESGFGEIKGDTMWYWPE